MQEHEVYERLHAAVEAAGGQRAFAKKHGLSVGYVNDVLRGNRELADRILATIGVERVIRREVLYRERPHNVAGERGSADQDRIPKP